MSFNLTSTPQRNLNNRKIEIPAGAAVGGGTVVNGIFFDRGAAADYDAWAELGANGWDWSGLLPYFKKVFREYFWKMEGTVLTSNRARTSRHRQKATPKILAYHGMNHFTAREGPFNPATRIFNSRRSVRPY
jgi:choline dehydrogenase-like flavoprotein